MAVDAKDSFLPADAAVGGLLYHYTSAATGLDHILRDGTLRFSPFGTMNDPREAKEWTVTIVTSDPTYGGVDLNKITADFNAELKSKIKVACFTADVVPDDRHPTLLDRGWSHPRMWAAYADDHAGLCFAFQRDRLIDRFEEAFESASMKEAAPVSYSDDDPLGSPAFVLNAAEVSREGAARVLESHAQRHRSVLFFTKLTDWSSETEFRLLIQEGAAGPNYLDYGDALVAVCVGHRWDTSQNAQLFEACSSRGVQTGQVWWRNGHPEISTYERIVEEMDPP